MIMSITQFFHLWHSSKRQINVTLAVSNQIHSPEGNFTAKIWCDTTLQEFWYEFLKCDCRGSCYLEKNRVYFLFRRHWKKFFFSGKQIISTLLDSMYNRNGGLEQEKLNYGSSINPYIVCWNATKSLGGVFVKQNLIGQQQQFSMTLDHCCWNHEKYALSLPSHRPNIKNVSIKLSPKSDFNLVQDVMIYQFAFTLCIIFLKTQNIRPCILSRSWMQ